METIVLRNRWDIAEMTGYEPKTTMWDEFIDAEEDGPTAVEELFNKWREKIAAAAYKEAAELVLVLNHRLWATYEIGNQPLARIYDKLYYKFHGWCCRTLKGEAMDYYYRVTD